MRRYFPKFLIRPPPSTHEEKVIHWNLCRTWHELSVHYNKKGGIEIEKLCQTCGISLNLGSSPCPTPVRRNVEIFFGSNIYFAFWLAFLLLCLTRARNSSKSTFPFPSASTSRNSLRTYICAQKIVTRFSQRWTILINAQLSLTRGIKFLYALASFDSKL